MKQSKNKSSSHVVVGIGASAGGTAAIKKIFSKMKASDSTSFVFAQHLDDSGKHIAVESLSKICKTGVEVIKDKMPLRPGGYYLIPPHTLLHMEKGRFRLSVANSVDQKLSVVDHMLTSLGREFGPCSVGIVLSGEGSDGALGIKALNEFDGLTIVQIPASALHSSMPEAAVATGAVDHILQPEKIGLEIIKHEKYLSDLTNRSESGSLKEHISSAVISICEILHKHTHHDFKHYKTSTLLRRIQRRMQVLQLNSVQNYIQLLNSNREEVETLFTELLINVTSFFRDQEAFEALTKDALTEIVSNRKSGEKIRIWIPGCSTGEEAYTIAILMRELIEREKENCEVQIIATDIDESALSIARKGSYPVTISGNVPPNYLNKYFTKRGGRYHVNKEIRELCLFSIHNLINDPPYSQVDLISCRNLLIYLGPHLQKKLFPVFHYALKKDGYLFLGTSESLTTHQELFKSVNLRHRIAQRKASAIRVTSSSIGSSVQSFVNHLQANTKSPEIDLNLIGQRIALDELTAKYAIVNDEGQIASVSAGIHKYVEISEGPFQNSIVKLVKPSLRASLRSLLKQARQEKRKVSSESCTLRTETHVEKVGLIVQPMPQLGEESSLFWVAFQYLGVVQSSKDPNADVLIRESDAELVDHLEKELAVVRTELDKTIQDLEASNEELKSSNEELLSMNEELQSANEELETSKEEIQIANEALQRSNSDLENLLVSTEIATLFLDNELKIQNFTPSLRAIYNISRVDIGRPITDITSRSEKNIQLPSFESVMTKKVVEDDFTVDSGRRILRRITPYKNSEGQYSGLVITFVDITRLRQAEELRQESESRFQIMANAAPVLIWISGLDKKRTWFNQGWLEFTGHTNEESLGEGWHDVVHPEDLQRYLEIYNSSFQSKTSFHIEYRLKHRTGAYRWISARGVPLTTPDGTFTGYIGACLDIHEQKTAREELRISQEKFQTLTELIPQLVWTSLPDGRCDYLSRQWEEYTGINSDQQLGLDWLDKVIHPEDRDRTHQHWMGAVQGFHEYEIEYRIKRFDGEYRWFQARGIPIRDTQGQINRWFGTSTDVHEMKLAQQRITANEKRLEMMIKTSPSFMCLLTGPDFVFEQVNEHYLKLVGHRDIIGKTILEALPEVRGQGFIELLERVRNSGEPFVGLELPIMLQRTAASPPEKRFVDFVYQPSEIIDGKIEGIFVHGVDVTDKVFARTAIENERENFRNLFKQTPEMVCILRGPEHRFEFVNDAHIKVLGFDATGKTLLEAQPESVEVHGILDEVYKTGKTAELREIPVTVTGRLRYFNLTYSARRNTENEIDGVMILGTEITDHVLARESIRLQKDAFELALNGAPLQKVLEILAKMVELQIGQGLLASVLIADKEGKRLLHGAAPNLPNFYNEAIHGLKIGPEVGSCGSAAFTKKLVIVSDIQNDPLWTNFKSLAQKADVAACWSTPILTSQGKLLGTFALYSRVARMPSRNEIEIVELAGKTTALILERQIEIMDRIESEERLKFALTSARMGTWEVHLDTQKVLLSDEAKQIFGKNKEYESTDLAIEDFIHPEDREHAKTVLAKALSNGDLYQDEYRILRPDGEIRWAHLRGRAHLVNGKPDRLTGIVLDIQAQKTAEMELQTAKLDAEKARAIAESASESKTRFLANMSHEIRTPLAAIIGFTEILKEELSSNEAVGNYFERISRNADVLKRLIDELLDLSKIEADKLEIHESVVAVDSLIADVFSTVSLKAEHKGIDLKFTWVTEKPYEIITDQLRLSQILTNIIGNAVKFTEQGYVHVEFKAVENELEICVIDTGIGLELDHQGRIFDPFLQADPSITRKFGGTGLGLSLSKKLAKRLGGDLVLKQSKPGMGTTFKISVPFKPVSQSQSVIQSSSDVTKSLESAREILRGKRILVVDDAQDNRVLISLFLKPYDIKFSEATNGIEAVERVMVEKYDLVLMDIQMPVMDGNQAMKKIKALDIQTPVVAVTAHALKEERDLCLQNGFKAYLTKPLSKSALIETLSQLLIAHRS